MKRLFVLSAILMLVTVPPAVAEHSAAPHMDADHSTIYAQRNAENAYYFGSTLQNDPFGTDPDPGYNMLGAALGAEPGTYDWVFPLEQDITQVIPLAEGNVVFDIYISPITSLPFIGGVSQGAGAGIVGASVAHGETEIASFTGEADFYAPGFTQVTAEVPISAMELTPGAELVFTVTFQAASVGAVVGASEATGHTSVTLPVDPGFVIAPPVVAEPGVVLDEVFEEIDATNIALDFVYDESSTQTWNYNWTNNFVDGAIAYAANVTQGGVEFLVIDGAAEPILEATLSAPFSGMLNFTDAFEGNWTIHVAFTDFIGDAKLSLTPVVPEESGSSSASTTGTSSGSDSSSSVSSSSTGETFNGGNTDESNDSPSAPFFLAAIGLLGAVFARRRL